MKAIILTATFLVALVPEVSSAQDFSADVVYVAAAKPAPSHPPSKLYVGKGKMRLETRGITGTILLVDGVEHSSIALFPAEKAYQHLPGGPAEYFRIEDAENACPNWEKAAGHKIACERVGHEAVDGRQTVKYRSKGASASAIWIDPALKFVVKWEGAGTGAELRNIEAAELAADLFKVPPGYETLKARAPKSKGYAKKPR